MAIIQTEIAKGLKMVPQAFTSGAVITYQAELVIPTGTSVTTSDIVELAVLPAFHRAVDGLIIPSGNYDGATADIGLMSGAVGDPSTDRTSGAEIFDDVALTALARITKGDALVKASTDSDRSIGVKFSKTITGAGQKLILQLLLTQ
ncbi:MAG TPA: hypothetical protein VNQ97_11885 [Burkholderiaceae bacterium]|nr:hypothetical protein [Burkholderiaceae bacterium]